MKLQGTAAKLAKKISIELELYPSMYESFGNIRRNAGTMYGYDTTKMFNSFVKHGSSKNWAKNMANLLDDYFHSILEDMTEIAFDGAAGIDIGDNYTIKIHLDDAFELLGRGDGKWSWKRTYKILADSYKNIFKYW